MENDIVRISGEDPLKCPLDSVFLDPFWDLDYGHKKMLMRMQKYEGREMDVHEEEIFGPEEGEDYYD